MIPFHYDPDVALRDLTYYHTRVALHEPGWTEYLLLGLVRQLSDRSRPRTLVICSKQRAQKLSPDLPYNLHTEQAVVISPEFLYRHRDQLARRGYQTIIAATDAVLRPGLKRTQALLDVIAGHPADTRVIAIYNQSPLHGSIRDLLEACPSSAANPVNTRDLRDVLTPSHNATVNSMFCS